jgi:hypothetical protein
MVGESAQSGHHHVEQPGIGLGDAPKGSAVESRDHVPKTGRFMAAAHPQIG